MWHPTRKQANQSDSRHLMVESQIGTLIPNLSFGHNLYSKYSNGTHKPILNIFVLRAFQWYNFFFNPMSFDPYNRSLKIPLGLQLPKWEPTWECVGSFPHTLLHSWKHEM
jgi:hypothetical protein